MDLTNLAGTLRCRFIHDDDGKHGFLVEHSESGVALGVPKWCDTREAAEAAWRETHERLRATLVLMPGIAVTAHTDHTISVNIAPDSESVLVTVALIKNEDTGKYGIAMTSTVGTIGPATWFDTQRQAYDDYANNRDKYSARLADTGLGKVIKETPVLDAPVFTDELPRFNGSKFDVTLN